MAEIRPMGTKGMELPPAAGNAVNPRHFMVRLNGDSVMGQRMDYYDHARAQTTVPIASIAGGNAQVIVTNRTNAATDRMVISKIFMEYPRQFDFGGVTNFKFELAPNPNGNYLEIVGFPITGSDVPVLYDLTNGQRYVPSGLSSTWRFRIAPSSVPRTMLMVSVAPVYVKTINSFEERQFVDYADPQRQGDFLIISNSLLTASSGPGDPVEEYRLYRSSPQGGGHKAAVYLMDQLEDQFAYGIHHSDPVGHVFRYEVKKQVKGDQPGAR